MWTSYIHELPITLTFLGLFYSRMWQRRFLALTPRHGVISWKDVFLNNTAVKTCKLVRTLFLVFSN